MSEHDEPRQPIPTPPVQRIKHDSLIGAEIDGRYRVDCVIGEGGMGTIYRAMHLGLGKPMALKVLRQSVSTDEQVVARFQQEARAASAIGDPHIAQAVDFAKLPTGQI